jgi:hypothetical protein
VKPLSEIIEAKKAAEAELLQRPGVTAVDVGYKYVKGKRTDKLAIRVHVAKKTDAVPPYERIPPEINGIPTDVIENKYVAQVAKAPVNTLLSADTGEYNPLQGGISIGPCRSVGGDVYAGTLGAIVRDRATGATMLLSNFHVMCIDNGWRLGDTMTQPSLIDTGLCPADVVATLQRASLGGQVDCAIAQQNARSALPRIVEIGGVAGVAAAAVGMAVRKRGRTTELTYGSVDGVSGSVSIDYGDGIGTVTLIDQISIAPTTSQNAAFSDHGDSGSVIVNGSNMVVGLLFAGATDGSLTWANPIQSVLNTLAVDLLTSDGIGGYDLESPADLAFAFDYDSSGKADHLALYRPGTGTIWILKNTAGQFSAVYAQGDPGSGIGGYDLKSPADQVFAFDYDSGGKADHLVLYRPGTGTFWILKNTGGQFSAVYAQGDPGSGIGGYDLKSPADRAFSFDYESSGKLDHLVLYRPGTGTIWILKNAAGHFTPVYAQGDPGSGIGGYDLKSPADLAFAFDYDSSGKLDHLALYRPGTGTMWILKNAGGHFTPVYAQGDPGIGIGGYDLKSPADRAFAFDYDNSGKLDHLALYRPGTGTIWILKNTAGNFAPVYAQGSPGNGIGGYDLKSPSDHVIAFDYESIGKNNYLIPYRPGTGTIWIIKNTNGSFAPVYTAP